MSTPYQPDDHSTFGQPAPSQVPAKKPFYKKWWFWLVVVVIIVIAAVAGGSGGDDSETSSDGVSDSTVSSPTTEGSVTDAPAPAPDAPAATEEGPTFPGQEDDDTVATGGQTITVDDVALTATSLDIIQGQFGGPYVASTVTIVNNSDEQIDFNPFEFMLQDPSGASRNTTFGCSDTPLNSGNLAPGGTVTGELCFEGTGQTGLHVLIFEPVFSFDSDRSVWLTTL